MNKIVPGGVVAVLACLFLVILPAGAASGGAAAGPVAPELGNRRAPLRVVIFEDLECPDCAHWHAVMKRQFFPVYGGRVRFEFRDFPLPQHPWAFNAAVVARYFSTVNAKLYFAWRDYCFTHQDTITAANLIERAAAFARAAGISRTALDAAFTRTALFAAVERDRAEGERAGVHHTPTVLVGENGPRLDRDGALATAGLTEATSPQQLALLLKRLLAP